MGWWKREESIAMRRVKELGSTYYSIPGLGGGGGEGSVGNGIRSGDGSQSIFELHLGLKVHIQMCPGACLVHSTPELSQLVGNPVPFSMEEWTWVSSAQTLCACTCVYLLPWAWNSLKEKAPGTVLAMKMLDIGETDDPQIPVIRTFQGQLHHSKIQ